MALKVESSDVLARYTCYTHKRAPASHNFLSLDDDTVTYWDTTPPPPYYAELLALKLEDFFLHVIGFLFSLNSWLFLRPLCVSG